MYRLLERIMNVDKNASWMLVFTRLVETFLTCIIPSAITMFVLSKKPVVNLMYAMYFAGMFICLCLNGFFWFQFTKVLQSWKRFLAVNLGVYAVFAAAMIIGFLVTNDAQVYTTFFGIYRAMEFFGVKTITSIVSMNVLSVAVMFIAGFAGMRMGSGHGRGHHHGHHHRHHHHSINEEA